MAIRGRAVATHRPKLERMIVTAGDGRVFDLGRPDSRLFRLRVRWYRHRRRHEFRSTQEASGANV